MFIITVAISSNEYANVICSIVATSLLISARPSLMDKKYNLYLVYKRKYNLHIISKRKHNLHLIAYIKFNKI
jgi:hypothetical protein